MISRTTNTADTRITTKNFISDWLIIAMVTSVILFAVYGFSTTIPLQDSRLQEVYQQRELIVINNLVGVQDELKQKLIHLTDPATQTGTMIMRVAQSWHIPFLPYWDGLSLVYKHNYYGHAAYLLGDHREFGWWYYFPLAWLVKTPHATQLLLLALVVIGSRYLLHGVRAEGIRTTLRRVPMAIYFLVIPPLLFFGITMTSSLNLGLRHILVIYPFIFVGAGWLLNAMWTHNHAIWKFVAGGLFTWYVLANIFIFPNYLAYFNELSGGPDNGTKYLVDSNIDWGQDVRKLKRYLDNSGIPFVCMAYFGQASLPYYKIDYRYLPDTQHYTTAGTINCVVAISATALFSKDGEYSWLQEFSPDHKIGYSIFIYDFRK